MFGAEDNPQFTVLEPPEGAGKILCVEYDHRVGKVGVDPDKGWLAVTGETTGHLYAQTFDPQPSGSTRRRRCGVLDERAGEDLRGRQGGRWRRGRTVARRERSPLPLRPPGAAAASSFSTASISAAGADRSCK